MGSQRVRHDRTTSLSLFTFMHGRRKWQPTPVFLPGESQGWGSLVVCCLWGHTESDTTEQLTLCTVERNHLSRLFNRQSLCPHAQFSSVQSLSRVRLFAIPWTVVYQTSLSMGFSRQEYWSGVPFPSPGDPRDPGIEPRSPAL